VSMSLDIKRNSYTRLLFQEIYCFKIFLLPTKCETSVYYPNTGGTIIQFWRRNHFSL